MGLQKTKCFCIAKGTTEVAEQTAHRMKISYPSRQGLISRIDLYLSNRKNGTLKQNKTVNLNKRRNVNSKWVF